jgi:ATP-dependent 26S proteasome regulatory subunit
MIIPSMDYEEGSLYFYKDNFIQISSENGKEKDKCKLTFYYPTGKTCADEEFIEFMDIDKRPNIFMVNQDYGNFNFSKFNINLPEKFDLELNYGEDFPKVSEKMIKSLHENSSGLYMLHGVPGTGKTTYIRYLASVLKKDVIFFPTSFVDEITNPSILSLLKKKTDCVMILEDAEKALTKRSLSDQPSLVSTLLNMTDGILGDVLKLNVIVTYNCDRQDIDEALLRKGRLKAEYSFQGLKKHQAEKLIKTLDLDLKADDNMTLADIYYAKSDEELIGNIKTLEKPKIGFMP